MNNTDKLLTRYFEGTASLAEEQALKEYFRGNLLLPQHEIYRPLFAAFEEEKRISAPPFPVPVAETRKKRAASRKLCTAAAGAAAAVLLALALLPFLNRPRPNTHCRVFINGKAVTNPRKAQQYADKMFMQADEIIRVTYRPFEEAKTMQRQMNADELFDELYRHIHHSDNQ